jgi:Flp pilus assembly protein TadD
MRASRQITASVLAVALVAAGCSKQEPTPQSAVPDIQHTATAKSISLTTDSSTVKPVEPTSIGPVSFADGETAYKAGNYNEAMRVFEQYTGEKPRNAWGHYMLGLSAQKSGDLEKAEKAFEEALSIDPNHLKSLTNLSRILIDQERYDDALNKLALAGEIDSESAEVKRLFGRTYHGQGKIEESMDAYRQAIALDDKDAWSMNNLGFLLIEHGRASDAVPVLARAVELKKDIPVFQNNLGMALEKTGRFTAAATAYNSALEADPGYTKAQKNLTRVEAVKVGVEEEFDLAAAAKSFVESTKVPVDATASAK